MDGSFRTYPENINTFGDTEDDVYYDANDQNRTDILKLVLYDLNSAIAPPQIRLMAIHAALEEFDHDDEALHDEELDLRADHILLQKLTYAMCIDPGSVEVGYICSAMEAVYRAGRTRLAQSFHEICDALLPLFVEMIRPPASYVAANHYADGAASGGVSSEKKNGASVDGEEGSLHPRPPKSTANGGNNKYQMNDDDIPPEQHQQPDVFNDNYAPQTGYGDFDEESAESIEIPAPAEEYFDQMNRMSSTAGSGVAAEQQPAADVHPIDRSDHTFGHIPAGTGEYLEEILMRSEASEAGTAAATDAGEGNFNPVMPAGAQANLNLNATNNNTLIPKPMGDFHEQALVLHQGNTNTSESYPTQFPQIMPQEANETIKMELDAAKKAMEQNQVPPPGPTKRLSIECEQDALDVFSKLKGVDDEAMRLRGGGKDGEEVDQFEDGMPINQFDPSTFQSEFNNLVREGSGGGGSVYDESQDNPFSDTSSFQNLGSSVGGYEREGGSNKDSHYSDTSSFRNLRSSAGAFSASKVGDDEVDDNGDDNGDDNQTNPFSDTSSFRNYGGSSVGGFSESGRGGGSVSGFSESGRGSVSGYSESQGGGTEKNNYHFDMPQRIDEFDESGRSENDIHQGQRIGEFDGSGRSESDIHQGQRIGEFDDSGRSESDIHQGQRSGEFDESGRSESDIHQGFNDSPNIHDEYIDEVHDGSAPQGVGSEFDSHGGYSGEAPAVFTGYDDDGRTIATAFDEDKSKTGDYNQQPSTGYSRNGSSFRSGSEYNSEVEQEKESVYSSAQGFEGNNPQFDYRKPYSESGFSAESSSRYQSDMADEWPNQNGPPLGSESMGGQFNEGWDNMYMPESTSSGFGMMSENENIAPKPEPYFPEPEPTGQYTIDDEEQEAKYAEFPYEDNPPYEGNDNNPRGNVQEEDIFQFQEPRLSMTSEDYFNYSDPVEGEICPLAVRKVIKIMRYFSRVLSAMEPLAQQSGLVDALLYHMTKKPHSVDYEDEISSRVDAIAVVVNLACAEENKIMMVYHPGLLDAVINIANHDPIDEAREHAAIVLMNLAYAEENKVHMVNQDHLLDTLVHLLSDVSPFTRRYASAALFTLACTYANTAVMARHCDGGILEALRKVLLNDPIDEARVNAAEALFNMARNNSDDTVENMGNHPRLLASLAHSVLSDYSADVRAYSARALEWLSADIHFPMPCHRILLKALTTASQWTKTTCIAEALKMQASLSENRKPMVEHPGLLDAIATLSLLDGITDDEVKTCAISALERLSKEASTRHIMVKNEGVMTALTKATFAKDGADDDFPDEGTPTALLMKTALKNLAEHM